MCLMDGNHQEIHLAENDCVTLLRFTLYIGIVWVYYTTTQLHSTVGWKPKIKNVYKQVLPPIFIKYR